MGPVPAAGTGRGELGVGRTRRVSLGRTCGLRECGCGLGDRALLSDWSHEPSGAPGPRRVCIELRFLAHRCAVLAGYALGYEKSADPRNRRLDRTRADVARTRAAAI